MEVDSPRLAVLDRWYNVVFLVRRRWIRGVLWRWLRRHRRAMRRLVRACLRALHQAAMAMRDSIHGGEAFL